jgi:hypothetical protein
MGRKLDVFVDLQFAGRLNSGSGDHKAELVVLVENLEDFGLQTLRLDGYCTVTRICFGNGAIARIEFELRGRGGWSPLIMEVRRPYVAVLYDR